MADRQNGAAHALAQALGFFSIGLGIAEMLVPRKLTEQFGMQGREPLLPFYGAREIAAGIGILTSGNCAPWIWARVAGDVVDLATLATGLDRHNARKRNVAVWLAGVAGVIVLDAICARALGKTNVTGREPVRDYSERRGMPRPPDQMRGAARKDFETPRDMRGPDALRPFTGEPRPSSTERTKA
jgi:hypothetical protein